MWFIMRAAPRLGVFRLPCRPRSQPWYQTVHFDSRLACVNTPGCIPGTWRSRLIQCSQATERTQDLADVSRGGKRDKWHGLYFGRSTRSLPCGQQNYSLIYVAYFWERFSTSVRLSLGFAPLAFESSGNISRLCVADWGRTGPADCRRQMTCARVLTPALSAGGEMMNAPG